MLAGARAETFTLGHGALCSRLPTVESIRAYSNAAIPKQSSIGREVEAWDKSGLLDIFRAEDGRWVILPSKELKRIEGVHFRRRPGGENDALCFGRLWIKRVIDFTEAPELGEDEAVTVRVEANLKDAHMLRYFNNLKVEPFDPAIFTLATGVAYADSLNPSFSIVMALKPTRYGWFLAKGSDSGFLATPTN